MTNLVTANLPRAYTWQPNADEPEVTYGPGRVQIPVALAEKLKAKRHIEDYGEESRAPTNAAHVVRSQELAPDFPAREYLFMAGHTTYGHVAELSREQLLALPNIGNAKADAILEAIKAADLPADVNAEPTTIRRNVVPIDSERKVPRHVALVTPDAGNSEEGDAA
jgi:hypothetical protein